MVNKTAICALGLCIGAATLVLTSGMSGKDFWANLAFGQRPVLRVTAALPKEVAQANLGARVEFELLSCVNKETLRAEFLPLKREGRAVFRPGESQPISFEATQRFSDTRWRVAAGCYQVQAQLVDAARRPLKRCAPTRGPATFLERNQSQDFTLAIDCAEAAPARSPSGAERASGIRAGAELNRPPKLRPLQLTKEPRRGKCEVTKICATADDPDAQAMRMDWRAVDLAGRQIQLNPAGSWVEKSAQRATHRECVVVPDTAQTAQIEVQVRDLIFEGRRAPGASKLTSVEDARLADFGLIARSSDSAEVEVNQRCDQAICPREPSKRVQNIRYWITREGRLLAPTSEIAQIRAGDLVDVQFDVAPGCDDTLVSFAAYDLSAHADQLAPQRRARGEENPASLLARRLGPGTHLLWNIVPDTDFELELTLGRQGYRLDGLRSAQ